MSEPLYIHNFKSPEVEEYLKEDDRIIIPVGSVEQHGPHAPLGTDSFVAQRISEDVSAEEGVMLCSPVWFGWSPHHLGLPGTISVDAEVMIDLFFEIVKSLNEHGFKKFIFLNGHRVVNISWLQIVAEKCKRKLGVAIKIFDPAYMGKEIVRELDIGSIGHAEQLETSQMLYLMPEKVDMDKAIDYEPEEKLHYHIDPSDMRDTLNYVPGTKEDIAGLKDVSGGANGLPTKSSKEIGKKIHEHLCQRLKEVLRDF
ncbi:MAG: creatininase family protein [Halanaerobiales bacterium]